MCYYFIVQYHGMNPYSKGTTLLNPHYCYYYYLSSLLLLLLILLLYDCWVNIVMDLWKGTT